MLPLLLVLPVQLVTHWFLELSKVTPAGSEKSGLRFLTAGVGTETPALVIVLPLNSTTELPRAFSTQSAGLRVGVGVGEGVGVGVGVGVAVGVGEGLPLGVAVAVTGAGAPLV
jgi:hypothetical protein